MHHPVSVNVIEKFGNDICPNWLMNTFTKRLNFSARHSWKRLASLHKREYDEVQARKQEPEDGRGRVLLHPVVGAQDEVKAEHAEEDGEFNEPRHLFKSLQFKQFVLQKKGLRWEFMKWVPGCGTM